MCISQRVKALVRRNGVDVEQIEDCIGVPNLNPDFIRADLLAQAEQFSDAELLEGRTLAGIYICPTSFEWLFARIHTHRMAEALPANPTTEQINESLDRLLLGDVKDGAMHLNDPISVKRPGRM